MIVIAWHIFGWVLSIFTFGAIWISCLTSAWGGEKPDPLTTFYLAMGALLGLKIAGLI